MNKMQGKFTLGRDNFVLDVNFMVPYTGVTALFGGSGSGKTTLLRCIAGLEKTADGFLQIGSDNWQQQQLFIPPHLRAIGFVFQDANLFNHLSVEQNLLYGWRRIGNHERIIQVRDVINILGLEDFLTRRPNQLSGGQRQRVAIARALLTSPRLLLMDEPLASLDNASKMEILPYLERLHKNFAIPIIYVTHSLDELVRIADHMMLMAKGKIIAQGPINEILTRTDLPLAHLDEACALIEGEVKFHDTEFHLTYLAVPVTETPKKLTPEVATASTNTLAISLLDLPMGQKVRVKILARDVSVSLHPAEHSSITNSMPARVSALTQSQDPAQVLITLDLGGATLLARITQRAVYQLKIAVDDQVFAQVKAVSLMR